jgi:hypothetical protein
MDVKKEIASRELSGTGEKRFDAARRRTNIHAYG